MPDSAAVAKAKKLAYTCNPTHKKIIYSLIEEINEMLECGITNNIAEQSSMLCGNCQFIRISPNKKDGTYNFYATDGALNWQSCEPGGLIELNDRFQYVTVATVKIKTIIPPKTVDGGTWWSDMSGFFNWFKKRD